MDNGIQAKCDEFFKQFPARTYAKGQNLVFAGDEPRYVFYLTKGNVRQYDISHRGDEIVVNVFKPPAFFPMSWAINKTPNDFFFQAATDAEVRLGDPTQVVEFIKNNPDVLFDLLRRVYRGTDGLLGRLVRLVSGSAHNRLLFELLIECRRFGDKAVGGGCGIAINEGELAARIGISRETVSREIQKLVKAGLVKVEHNKITVKNLKQLEERLSETI